MSDTIALLDNCEGSNALVVGFLAGTVAAGDRVSRDLVALYDFEELSGLVVHDRSGVPPALDLKLAKPETAQFRGGALIITSSSTIASEKPAAKLIEAVRKSRALTIEAWVRPEGTRQQGPARIVSLSADTGQRNFTLGQENDACDVRLRTTSTNTNGIPSTTSPPGSLTTALTHVVYTRDADGTARIYIDGRERAVNKVAGDVSNWSGEFRLLLANELTGDRTGA